MKHILLFYLSPERRLADLFHYISSERGAMISSSEGKEISKKVWEETLKVLIKEEPKVKEIVSAN